MHPGDSCTKQKIIQYVLFDVGFGQIKLKGPLGLCGGRRSPECHSSFLQQLICQLLLINHLVHTVEKKCVKNAHHN